MICGLPEIKTLPAVPMYWVIREHPELSPAQTMRTAHPDPAQTLGVCGEEKLHPCIRHRLHRHQVFGFPPFWVGIHVHVAHVETKEDEHRRGSHPFAGAGDSFLDFFGWKSVVLEVALELEDIASASFCLMAGSITTANLHG
jgi:hypothetical protein